MPDYQCSGRVNHARDAGTAVSPYGFLQQAGYDPDQIRWSLSAHLLSGALSPGGTSASRIGPRWYSKGRPLCPPVREPMGVGRRRLRHDDRGGGQRSALPNTDRKTDPLLARALRGAPPSCSPAASSSTRSKAPGTPFPDLEGAIVFDPIEGEDQRITTLAELIREAPPNGG